MTNKTWKISMTNAYLVKNWKKIAILKQPQHTWKGEKTSIYSLKERLSSTLILDWTLVSLVWRTAFPMYHTWSVIDPSHKSHNALDIYPTMYHFVTEMCTIVCIFVTKWCTVGYGTGALWDLWIRSLCCVFLWLGTLQIISPIFFRVTSLVLGNICNSSVHGWLTL